MRSWQHCGQEWTYVNLIHVDDGGRWAVGAQAIANALIQGHAPEGTMVPSPPPEREGMEVTDLPRLGVLEVWACGWERHMVAKCTHEYDLSVSVPGRTCVSGRTDVLYVRVQACPLGARPGPLTRSCPG